MKSFKNQANKLVRDAMQEYGVPYWRVAKKLDIHEITFGRRLREELPVDEQERLVEIVKEVARDDV